MWRLKRFPVCSDSLVLPACLQTGSQRSPSLLLSPSSASAKSTRSTAKPLWLEDLEISDPLCLFYDSKS